MDFLLDLPLDKLINKANDIRKKFIGQKLELCSIINAKSGLCSEDCKFCAQSSKHSCSVDIYPLKSKEDIVFSAEEAKSIGADKFGIVTSGNRLKDSELEIIASAVSEIKKKVDIDVCGSLGNLKKDQFKKLKESGLSRYHHNIETSPRFYKTIVSTHNFQERINTIKNAKNAGLEVCSGGIIGIGEDWQDRLDMANILRDLEVDSVPLNFLVPIKGTSLEDLKPVSIDDAIRVICIFRIILQDKAVKVAAGREITLKDSQVKGFMAGASGMLIGGYLTVKGGSVEEDYNLIDKIRKVWNE